MARAKRYRNITIHPSQGGQLVGSASDDVPLSQSTNFLSSSANYTQKLNFRRETDGELRREGWELFAPTGEDDALKSDDPIRGMYQFTGTDGTPIFIAIAGNKLYRLSSGDRRFAIIGSQDLLNANPVAEYSTVDGQDSPDPTQITIGGSLYGIIGESSRGVDWFDNDADDFTWSEIYTFPNHLDAKDSDGTYKDPFEGGAYRWEFVEIRNHLVINNGIDLPVVFKSEWSTAVPLFGLRENGIVSVGTISGYQDRLFCGDLTTFETGGIVGGGYDNWFKYAKDPYGSIYPQAGQEDGSLYTDGVARDLQAQRYQYRIIYSAEGDPKLFNTGIIDSTSGSFIAEGGGLPGKITINSGVYTFTPAYSRWSEFGVGVDGSMFQEYEFGNFGGEEHMGIFLTSPESGEKLVDESYANGDIDAAIQTLIRSYPERALPYMSTGGPSVSINGDSYPSFGFSVTEIIQTVIANVTTLSGIFFEKQSVSSYKLVNGEGNDVVFLGTNGEPLAELDANGARKEYSCVMRPYAEQIKKPAAIQEFVQDGSRILKMKQLADKLVVYRDTGFYFVTQSNSNINPFAIDPRYSGGRVPDFRHTIIDLGGNQHLFMGNSGVYVINRSSVEPKPVELFELGPPFWHIVPPELAEFVYAVDNPVTREIFINCPLGYKVDGAGNYVNELGERSNLPCLDWGVIAYDYINQTLSQIDQSFTSCVTIRKPKYNRVGPEEIWFLLAVHQSWDASSTYVGSAYRDDENYGGSICRYGYGPPQRGLTTPYRVYNRIGYGYTSKIKSGLIDFGDSFSDKEVRSYVLELSSKYGTTPIKVKISTNTAPQGTEVVETLSEGVNYVILNNMVDENMIPLYVRAPYLRDQIIVEPEYIENGYGGYGYVRSKIENKQNKDYWADAKPTVIENPIKLVGRTFEVSGIDTRATTQTINQG
jgi:hypothetical protein